MPTSSISCMAERMETGPESRVREGFPNQRLVVVPANVLRCCRKLALVKQLYVTHIGSFPCAPHHYVDRKEGAPESILIYCLSGHGFLEMQGTQQPVRQGNVFIIPPHTPHIYRACDQDPWSLFWIHFDGSQSEEVLLNLGTDPTKSLLYVPDCALMRDAFEDVHACLNYHYSNAGLLAMSAELMRFLSKIKLHQSHIEPQHRSAQNRAMSTIQFMEHHLDMPLTLAALAAHAGQSVPYYSKLFKEGTNQSPTAYFIQLKIRKACELLDLTNLNINEIASELGYPDPYYFSRLFKKVQGCSPMTYRKTCLNP